jgi:hypothetical protein
MHAQHIAEPPQVPENSPGSVSPIMRDDPTILVYELAPWITRPGLYRMTNARYQADPVVGGSVSSTVLRKMTPPEGTPWHARHYLDQERKPQTYFDVGSAFHVDVLGTGGEVVEVKAPDWKTQKARAERDVARAAGKIPLLTKEAGPVRGMVAALRRHPFAAGFFTPGAFTAEFVIVWPDEETGLMCRAMIDCVPDYSDEMIIVDLKSKANHADPLSVSTSIARFQYDQQFAHYIAGIRALIKLGILPPVTAIKPWIVVVGKEEPYVPLARPIEDETIRQAEIKNRKALDLYAECSIRGVWPGYDDPDDIEDVEPIGVPRWAKYQFQAASAAGIYDTSGEQW